MERRKALATAGAVTTTALAATIALGANLGLFGLTSSGAGPGTVEPVSSTTKPAPRTEVIDVPVPVQAPGASGSAAAGGSTTGAPRPGAAPAAAAPSGAEASTPPAAGGDEHELEHEVEHPEGPEDDD